MCVWQRGAAVMPHLFFLIRRRLLSICTKKQKMIRQIVAHLKYNA